MKNIKLKLKFKEQKGSITLFVLLSILFFIVVLVGLYINSSNKIQKQQREIEKIKNQYETQNVNDLYNKIYEKNYNDIMENNL